MTLVADRTQLFGHNKKNHCKLAVKRVVRAVVCGLTSHWQPDKATLAAVVASSAAQMRGLL